MRRQITSGMERKITLREFARAIGMSPTQVSNAISGNGRVSDATRAFVQEKMAELHYTPNLNARRLGTGRSYLVALNLLGYERTADPYVLQMARAILKGLIPYGYELTLCINNEKAEVPAQLHQRAISRSHDGTILFGYEDVLRHSSGMMASVHHPCVSIGRDPLEGLAHVGYVCRDFSHGIKHAAQTLVALGHRRIGFINIPHADDDQMAQCFRAELASLGVNMTNDYIFPIGVTADDGAVAMGHFLRMAHPPTAVMARTDVLAVGAFVEAERLGLRVPEDISIVGHDNMQLRMPRQERLATVDLDIEAIGKSAVEQIMTLLDHPDVLVAPRVINSRFIQRDSIGPCPSR